MLPPSERPGLAKLLAVTIFVALFEITGVLSILPFMAVVLDPSAIQRSPKAIELLAAIGAQSAKEQIVAIGFVVALVLVLGNAATVTGLWMQQRFLVRLQQRLQADLFTGYLSRPYSFHVERDVASLWKVLFSDISSVMNNAVGPLVTATTKGFVSVGLLVVILVRDPLAATGTVVVLGGAYLTIYRLAQKRQEKLGTSMAVASARAIQSALEGLGGIKELIVLGRERETIWRFDDANKRQLEALAASNMTAILPRYLLETILLTSVVILTLSLILRGGGAQAAIPTLALYAFIGYRLMPMLQQIFSAAVTLRFAESALDVVERDVNLIRINPMPSMPVGGAHSSIAKTYDIRFEGVGFTYPGATRPSLRDISLVIAPKESIGLVGRTGAGKSTLADLLLGLYEPTAGRVTISGSPLTLDTVRAWRQRVGYVPQSVFLANATIAQNIAFGIPETEIDNAAVERAARMAQADEFLSKLPLGLETLVGERGVRLSGGQRQRLGIARALYHNPDVLIFDEATSALDGLTEEAVMQAIRTLSVERTIILIAHRIRTVEACDRILLLEDGTITADGSYSTLVACSPTFRQLIGPTAPVTARQS
jgi:ABC-type multidrug transport system fused ATPase/permease subunit